MSSSNAAAIRRRVGAQALPPPTSSTPNSKPASTTPPQATPQMSLQQVISTVDKRLTQLESLASTNGNQPESNDLSLVVDEFNSRFELIVTEINSLKDIVLRLQTYTMDVNKMLVDERIHILSDLGNNSVTSSTVNTRTRADSLTSADLKTMVEQEYKFK
jgi:hypothetical protein